jgi:hypothetical protein
MTVFKSTRYILDNPWAVEISADSVASPPKTVWKEQRSPTIEEIDLWEQIYYQPGNVGIYAAYEPYTDFYLLTYNLFMDKPWGIQTFCGPQAEKQLWQKIKDLKIPVTLHSTWTEDTDQFETDLPPLQ